MCSWSEVGSQVSRKKVLSNETLTDWVSSAVDIVWGQDRCSAKAVRTVLNTTCDMV